MSPAKSLSLLAALLSATRVAAHGHVTNVVVNGVYYAGFDINSYPYMSNPPKVAAWTTPNTANGFIAPSQYNSADIICHENATNAQAYIEIAAGDRIQLQWTAWPSTHHGPVIDMLADCGESCATVDKTSLKFFKIDGVGLVDDSAVPGTWGDDQMIANDNSWMVEIPKSIAPGNYVLRHELIALHSAGQKDGAQNYPQCFNLKVTGSGTDSPAGTLGTELYSETDPGIVVNIYAPISSYTVPGPAMYPGAVSITQTTSAITSTGTATAGSGAGSTPAASSAGTPKYSTPVPSSSPTTFVTMPAPSTPASRTPKSSTPESSTPESSTPMFSTPTSSTSTSSTPASRTPASSTPASSTPTSSTSTSSTSTSSTPTSSTPASRTPMSKTPTSSTPESSTPKSSSPESSTPKSSTPTSSTSTSSTPTSSTPASRTPMSKTPASSTPESSTPESSTPESSSPESSTPESSTPMSSTPTSRTPTSSTPTSSTSTSSTPASRTPASSTPTSSTPTSSTPASSTPAPEPTSTTAATQTSSAPGATQSIYGQCGGRNWTGPTGCASGLTCKNWNPYYSQCVPE